MRANPYPKARQPDILYASSPRKWSSEDREKIAKWYATLTLAGLRTRQSLNEESIRLLCARRDGGVRVAESLEDCRVMEKVLDRAVMIHEFPEMPTKRRK